MFLLFCLTFCRLLATAKYFVLYCVNFVPQNCVNTLQLCFLRCCENMMKQVLCFQIVWGQSDVISCIIMRQLCFFPVYVAVKRCSTVCHIYM